MNTQLYIRPSLPAYGPPEPWSFWDNLLNWAWVLFLLKVGGCEIPWLLILAPVAAPFVLLPGLLLSAGLITIFHKLKTVFK